MDLANDTLWAYIWKTIEWIGSALVAVAIFMFKGYREEFANLKASNQELKDSFIEEKNNSKLLLQTVKHIDNNLKNWDNGSKAMLSQIMELEKTVEVLKVELSFIKEKMHENKM